MPTGCTGWTAVDLGFHLLQDCRRALVALNTPAGGPVDTDAVEYRRSWQPPTSDDQDTLLGTRAPASVLGGLGPVQRGYAEAAAAVVVAAGRVRPGSTCAPRAR